MNKKIIVLVSYLIASAIILILGVTNVLEKSWGNLIWGVGFLTCGFTILLNKNDTYPFKQSGYILNLFGFFGLSFYLFDVLDIKNKLVIAIAVCIILEAIVILVFQLLKQKK